MNRTLNIMLVGLLAVSGSLAQDTPPDERLTELLKQIGDKSNVTRSKVFSLSVEEKQLLLEHFRKRERDLDIPLRPGRSTHAERATYGPGIARMRAVLGDPEILEPWLQVIREGDVRTQEFQKARDGLAYAGNPETIVQIAPLIQVDEPLGGDPFIYIPPPRSYVALGLMFKIVAASPEFDGKTRKWAEDNIQIPPDQYKALMRQWWKDNEGLFKAGDYKAIKPGEEIRAGIEEAARKTLEEALAAQANWKPAPKPEGAASSTGDFGGVKSQPVAATRAAAGYVGYVIVGGLVLLLAVGVWFYNRFARS